MKGILLYFFGYHQIRQGGQIITYVHVIHCDLVLIIYYMPTSDLHLSDNLSPPLCMVLVKAARKPNVQPGGGHLVTDTPYTQNHHLNNGYTVAAHTPLDIQLVFFCQSVYFVGMATSHRIIYCFVSCMTLYVYRSFCIYANIM